MTAAARACLQCGDPLPPGPIIRCGSCRQSGSTTPAPGAGDPVLKMAAMRAYAESGAGAQRPRIDWRGFWIGLAVALIAIAISVGSVDSASRAGGTYVVFWGAAIWGGWKALKSLAAGL